MIETLSPTYTVKVSRAFYEDHVDRHDAPWGRVVGKRVEIELDIEQLGNLYGDADYWSDMTGGDRQDNLRLCKSAETVVDALKKQLGSKLPRIMAEYAAIGRQRRADRAAEAKSRADSIVAGSPAPKCASSHIEYAYTGEIRCVECSRWAAVNADRIIEVEYITNGRIGNSFAPVRLHDGSTVRARALGGDTRSTTIEFDDGRIVKVDAPIHMAEWRTPEFARVAVGEVKTRKQIA